jgi:hypothetical protein
LRISATKGELAVRVERATERPLWNCKQTSALMADEDRFGSN